MSMITKWAMIDGGENYYVGEIVSVEGNFVFVRIRPNAGPSGGYKLFDMVELTGELTMFFDTEKELDDFISWAESGPSPRLKVVSIKGKVE